MSDPASVQLAFAASLVDEWYRAGVRQAVLSPGSRSTPLALALVADGRLVLDVRLDERSAGFYALGAALASRAPVVIVTTSGTAAAELHAAVCEADLAGVALVVCTADRPFELHGVGAPQTIDQRRLYGESVRFFADPGVADQATSRFWRSLGARLVAEATSGPSGPGPVQVNLAFREPFGELAGLVPPGRPDGRPWHVVRRSPGAPPQAASELARLLGSARRGILVAGAGASGDGRGAAPQGTDAMCPLRALAQRAGLVVLADPRAWPRTADRCSVAAFDALLRSTVLSAELVPDLVLHAGAPPASKVLARWCADLAAAGVPQVLLDPFGRFRDPERSAGLVLGGDEGELALAAGALLDPAHGLYAKPDPSWQARWRTADSSAQEAFDQALRAELEAPGPPSEPGIARALYGALPDGATLFVSSSMPVRDVEWFARPRDHAPRVLANRGANGIDGVVSTILGVASTTRGESERAVVGLIGDLAFLHDLSGLIWGRHERPPDVTLVVVDNAGGGIFSFLPVAGGPAAGGPAKGRFERLFATPQAVDCAAIASALGAKVSEVRRLADLAPTLEASFRAPGVKVLVVQTDRQSNVQTHDHWNALAAAAGEATIERRAATRRVLP